MLKDDQHRLGEKALKNLLPFSITYWCEQAFQHCATLKNKYRNKLDMHLYFSLKLSSLQPDLQEVIEKIRRSDRKNKKKFH